MKKNKKRKGYQKTKKAFQKKEKVKTEPIILGDYVFPIYGLSKIDGKTKPIDIHGTAFYIGQKYFITALHVIEKAEQSPETKIGFFSQVSDGCVEMSKYEVKEKFPKSDLAIIESEEIFQYSKKPKAFKWNGRKLFIFEEVRAMGFPHGYDSFKGVSIGRGFSGNILCETPFEMGTLKTNCYELSFQAPRGLSGGCLLDKDYNVHGLIIGNSQKEMFVHQTVVSEKEISGEEETTKRIETINETTFIGMAITENQIFSLESKELGMNFHDYLKKMNYIKRRKKEL